MSATLSRAGARIALALCLFLILAAAPVRAVAQPLPSDPRLVTGELPNGLKYIVRQHNNPPGRAAIWMHVSTGSLNETDQQRGLAHYLEHMAFNGSEHFPPNSVIHYFQSLGLNFGSDQNAHTSFDETVYELALPDNKPETLEKAMLFMSDVASKLSLLPKEVDDERQIIQEERRTRLSGRQRVQDEFLQKLIPGSRFGERLPIGTKESIDALKESDFKTYYGKWYVPANMTVMVVADMDPKVVVEQIKKNFAGAEKKPKPADLELNVKPYEKPRAIVASDSELTDAQIGMIWIEPAIPPTTTKELMRARLVEGAGSWMFNRRLQQRVLEGKASFHGADAASEDLFHTARLSIVDAHGEPGNWKAMLNEISTELRRANLYGFTDQELDDARKALISGAERALETEPTEPARAILGELNSAVSAGEPVLSAEQALALTRELVPTLTAKETSARFAELFDTSKPATFHLQLPSSAEVPTEAQLTELGVKALEVKPENEAVAERPKSLLEKLPEPGKIAESGTHDASKVYSAWLDNGARVHFRKMDYRKDEVGVTITFAGGQIQETQENHGITEAAAVALARPATSKLTSTNIRDLMTGKKVSAAGRAGVDTVAISVSGSPEELETGMQLAHLIMTDPVVEKAALDQWKQQQKQVASMRKKVPEGVLGDLAAETIFPKSEIRVKPLEAAEIDRATPEAAQAWLRKIFATAPIEVSVVGDIDQARAMELVQRYVGSLPKRERITTSTLADLRKVPVPAGPQNNAKMLKTQTDKAIVLSGFFGTDLSKLRDVRLLNMATKILSTRAIETIREKDQLAYSPQVTSGPAIEFPGHGVVLLSTPTAPGKVDALLAAVTELFDEFSKDGPTQEEVDIAKKQFANILDEQMREPSYWTRQLSTMNYRGTDLDQLLGGPAAYQGFTVEQVKDAFNRYYKPEARFSIHVAPEAKADKEDKGDEAPATPKGPSEPPVQQVKPGMHPQGPAVDPAPPMPK
jgi:zinc protease